MHIAFLTVKDIRCDAAVETYTREVGRRLVERGHHVTVYEPARWSDGTRDFEGMQIVAVPGLPIRRAGRLSTAAAATFHCVSGPRPDVVHLHGFLAGSLAPLLRLRGVPCLLQASRIEWKRPQLGTMDRALLRRLEKVAVRAATACTATTKHLAAYLEERHGRRADLIPVGTALRPPPEPLLLEALGLQPGGYTLFAGHLVPGMGVHQIVEALHLMRRDEVLVLAGDAPYLEKYRTLLQRLGGGDRRIHWLGRVEAHILQALFAHARIFLMPSEAEFLPLPLLEAMSYGRACLVSDTPTNVETIGGAGLKYTAGSAADLAAKWAWLLDHPGEAASFGDIARLRVERHFTWDSIVTRLETVYAAIGGLHSRGRFVNQLTFGGGSSVTVKGGQAVSGAGHASRFSAHHLRGVGV